MIEFLLVGAVAGFLAGLLGIGGGFVVVPALSWLLLRHGFSPSTAVTSAVATSLACMLLTSLSSLLAHYRSGAINWPLVRRLATGLAAGALLGAVLAQTIPGQWLGRIVGVCAMLAGLNLVVGRRSTDSRPLPGTLASSATAIIFGGLSSLVGIGGGALISPWQMWHGIRPHAAVATSAACGYPIAVAGTVAFVLAHSPPPLPSGTLGYVYLPAFVAIALTGALTAPLGAATVHRLNPAPLKRLFGVFLMLVGLGLVAGI